MPKVMMVLSGCGVIDGSEIHEACLALLFFSKAGFEYSFCAPNSSQVHVINHLTSEVVEGETRSVLMESARIARGNIVDIKGVTPNHFDILFFPGGFGAAKNLCDYAFKGRGMSVNRDVEKLIRATHKAGKPVGAVCIAPIIIARVLGGEKVLVTIGNDKAVAEDVESFGAKHESCKVNEACIDSENLVVTAPAYMLAENIAESASGIEECVKALVELIKVKV